MHIHYLPENLKNIVELMGIAESIKGRKKLQKIVYMLKKLGAPFKERFKLYYFGPYSVDLQLEVDDLVASNILLEEVTHNLCVYSLNKEILDNSEDLYSKLKKYASIIKTLNQVDTPILELLSTYLYLLSTDNNYKLARKKLKILKPHIFDKFDKAMELWKEISNKPLQRTGVFAGR